MSDEAFARDMDVNTLSPILKSVDDDIRAEVAELSTSNGVHTSAVEGMKSVETRRAKNLQNLTEGREEYVQLLERFSATDAELNKLAAQYQAVIMAVPGVFKDGGV